MNSQSDATSLDKYSYYAFKLSEGSSSVTYTQVTPSFTFYNYIKNNITESPYYMDRYNVVTNNRYRFVSHLYGSVYVNEYVINGTSLDVVNSFTLDSGDTTYSITVSGLGIFVFKHTSSTTINTKYYYFGNTTNDCLRDGYNLAVSKEDALDGESFTATKVL